MTNAKLIDGKAFSNGLVERVAAAAGDLASRIGRAPALAVVLVGDNAASAVYVRNKIERTTAAGMRSIEHRLGSDTSQADLLAIIDDLNADDGVDGILVQLPLPDQIDEAAVINAISPDKDVDGFHVVNAGRLATGQDALVPWRPMAACFCCRIILAIFPDSTPSSSAGRTSSASRWRSFAAAELHRHHRAFANP